MKTKSIPIKIKEGHSTPSYLTKLAIYRFCLNADRVLVSVDWDDPEYDLKDEDQKDWSKIFGTSKNILPTIKHRKELNYRPLWWKRIPFTHYYWVAPQHRNSKRMVWRWNLEDKVAEWTTYYEYHNCKRVLPDKNTIRVAPKGSNTGSFWLESKGFFNLTPYFGGNEKAPCDIEYTLNLSK